MKALRILNNSILSNLLVAAIWAFALAASAASAASSPYTGFHATTPAGYDVLTLRPAGTEVSFLGLIECPELEGVQHVSAGMNARVISADGAPLRQFPRNFSFRITASLRKTVLSGPSGEVASSENPQDFLLKLKFNLKAYDGLAVHQIEPESVQMIGVPADIPYDERVYRLSFSIDKMPITDRFVLEVISPNDERLTRFHFDLL